MSKYNHLWKYVAQKKQAELILSSAQIGQIAGGTPGSLVFKVQKGIA